MSKEHKEKKPKIRFFVAFLTLVALLTSGFAIFNIALLNEIENLIRYCVIGVFILIDIILVVKTKRRFKPKKNKKPKNGLLIALSIIYIIITATIGILIFIIYGTLSNLNNTYVTYSSSLVVMSDNEAQDIKDIKNFKIAILEDVNNPEGHIIPQEIIKEHKLYHNNEIIEYEDYSSMISDLYVGDIDAIFITSSYASIFSSIEEFHDIATDTRVIISQEKQMRKADTSKVETASRGKSLDEPFTILLMGLDGTEDFIDSNTVDNGDTIILITFNPITLNATMLSIPRDSYVPIACLRNRESKITHAAAYGTDCMINTIQNFLDVDIDYYAKINFKGFVNLIDAVGGVQVDVPKKLCTDNSNREVEICIEPGLQTLQGEQALVFARNRYDLPDGDFGRNVHQQEIIMALMNKIREVNSVGTFMNILNNISNTLDTNLTANQILSFYNVAKDILRKSNISDEGNVVNIQQLGLEGHGQMIYEESMRMMLWNYILSEGSVEAVTNAMKVNLGLKDPTIIKEFSFSINEPFEKPIPGKGNYKPTVRADNTSVVPNFVGLTEAEARALANRNGIRISINGTGPKVVSQSVAVGSRLNFANSTITISLGGSSNTVTPPSTTPTTPTEPQEPTTPTTPDPDPPTTEPDE